LSETARQEDTLQDEPRNPDADAQEDPTDGTPEEANEIEGNLNLISVINNNPVIIHTLPYDQFVAPRDQGEEWI
jgi:hypothetical protein